MVDTQGQDIIHLKNPSFEDMPRPGIRGIYYEKKLDLRKNYEIDTDEPYVMKDWLDCGLAEFPEESPPDIHPVKPEGTWEVTMDPKDGRSYLGLVTRYNDTYEAISQKLNKSFKKGRCYSFQSYLARSDHYKSHTRRSYESNQMEDFILPVRLRIWGGSRSWPKKEILAQSGPIESNEWKMYEFKLEPSRNHSYFTIEAYYLNDMEEPYNGHVLVDNLSPITEVNCK